jgi:hypothetical protein
MLLTLPILQQIDKILREEIICCKIIIGYGSEIAITRYYKDTQNEEILEKYRTLHYFIFYSHTITCFLLITSPVAERTDFLFSGGHGLIVTTSEINGIFKKNQQKSFN